ncbi:MAG: DUF2849 domain-containing protein [Rhodospirillales bacterium]|jgi:hypothetical protein|nr:DUF2849 domain-containing protein [Rhodospirillales bacterium]
MKNSIETYFVLSSNRLLDGATVYLTSSGDTNEWNTDITKAEVYTEATREQGLALAHKSFASNEVHEPHAFEITGQNEPLGVREKIRAAGGPSIPYGEDAVPSKHSDYSI